ncbi:MAG: DUF4062 domain-containing protein [Deltaproteobacteria bacterium]|nr:DUF4062 domain-containing protein [Deltaproteobacteria bacterium]
MTKPRIFLSSTCFDLSEVRDVVRRHLEDLGMDVVASDHPGFGVAPVSHSHNACLDEVDRSDYLVLIIGGRRGGTYIGNENSITNEEYTRAARRRIPIFTFVKKEVQTAKKIYRDSAKANVSSMVEDVRVFDFIDLVHSASESNWIWPFENGGDVCHELTAQFAHIVYLFSEGIVRAKNPSGGSSEEMGDVIPFPGKLLSLPDEIKAEPKEEAWVTEGLKKLHGLLSRIIESEATSKQELVKALWVFGRYGALNGERVEMDEETLKMWAWSRGRGTRVFKRLASFGVVGGYEADEYSEVVLAWIGFEDDDDGAIAGALAMYASSLAARHGKEGLKLFQAADMVLYA